MKRKRTSLAGGAAPYDHFAWFYNKYWATEVSSDFLNATERLLLKHVRPEAHLLDVCCGTGQLAASLIARGYCITGLDLSREMLRYARRNAPAAKLMHADAASFRLDKQADGAVALFDSFNHLLSTEHLRAALLCVHSALAPGASFLFDLNTKAGYARHLRDHYTIVKRDGVLALRGEYAPMPRLARFHGTVFRSYRSSWQRSDFEIVERCHERREVEKLLRRVGFAEVQVLDAEHDVGLIEHRGRLFYVARKDAQQR